MCAGSMVCRPQATPTWHGAAHDLPSGTERKIGTVLANDEFFDYATATAKGKKMPRGDKTAIMQYAVLGFDMDTQQRVLEAQNCKLVALRDNLLPRLMSGEIDVSDIQL